MDKQNEQLDLLTGLPNITFFRSLSQKVLNDPVERSKGLVIIYFDIKNFRAFNYHYGFDFGDRCLVKVGNTIHKVFSELYVSRFADDHFSVIAYNIDVEMRLELVRKQLINKRTNKPIAIKSGIYIVPPNGEQNAVHAYDNAKLACESIKKQAGILNCYYTDELGQREKLREHIIETIDEAIAKKYIQVYYQPIVHVISGRLCGYEGLARWQDPEFGFLSPADFISTLEEARLIHRLDTYMIHKICQDNHRYQKQGKIILPVSVNLSAFDFQMTDMPVIANQAIKENKLPKNMLNIEITESAFSKGRNDVHDVLEQFRRMGFEIWMDNFGSKYSSLNILKEVDVDLLKIDMRFLKEFHTSKKSRIILKNIMNMAKELGIQTLVEGVEDEIVLEFLRQIGCEKAQGYLFGKPASSDMINYFELNPESVAERKYYGEIGCVNLLSQAPLESVSKDKKNHSELNDIPLAIFEFDGKNFKFLMSNDKFCNVFKPLGIDGKDSPEEIFNNNMLQFSIRIRHTAQQAISNGKELVQDFVTSEGFNNLRLRCIAFNSETKVGAILSIVEQVSGNEVLKREKLKETALKFLYSLYNRVDLIKQDGTAIENVYLNSAHYLESFTKDSVEESLNLFAKHNIYAEDRRKFLNFYDLTTIDERFEEFEGNYIIDYFRTRDDHKNFSWQMYMMIPIIMNSERYLLSCTRGIDAERMRRLPEIDRTGIEYYDMPGNPIFLLLASHAFTSTLGYGSFEQFLHNSFYVEANLTANKVLYMHLGKQGIMSDNNINTSNYNIVIRDMILNTVVNDEHREVEKFFKRTRLLFEYKSGKVFGEMEFLRRPESNSKPRYLHTSYQLRESNETGDIHAFFLAFDIDAYRRTNESMIELIERDNLTGLYNRGTAVSLILNYIENANNRPAALIILDLDNFKQINDRFGHYCGDMIIKDAALRMKCHFSEYGLVARIGGDEFLIFIKDLNPQKVDELLYIFSNDHKEVDYHSQNITYTMSIGYATYPNQGMDYKNLYQNADMALYSVKMSGRANYRIFSPDMINFNRKQLGFSINQISEGMPGGFLVYRDNETQEILYANKRLLDIYECDNIEDFRKFTGNSFKGCVLDEDWDIINFKINEQIEKSEGYDYVKYRARTAKGNIRFIEDFGRLVHSPDDGDIFYVFIVDLENKEKIN